MWVCHQNTKHRVVTHFIVVHPYPLPWHTGIPLGTVWPWCGTPPAARTWSRRWRAGRGAPAVWRAAGEPSSPAVARPSPALHIGSSSVAGCRGIVELSSGGRQPESSHPRNCRGIIINYGRAAPAPTVCIAAQNMQVMFDNVGWMETILTMAFTVLKTLPQT